MTAVGGPLVIAACTEFTSLILLRFVEERRRGLEPQEAVDVAASRTGRAFIVSGLTAIAGVAVLSFSSLPLLRDFGRLVAMNVFIALLSALVVLPPMLVWADKRNWVSRGLVNITPEPYVDTPPLGGAAPAPAD
jgi:predicted RND superfamily exporter protein